LCARLKKLRSDDYQKKKNLGLYDNKKIVFELNEEGYCHSYDFSDVSELLEKRLYKTN